MTDVHHRCLQPRPGVSLNLLDRGSAEAEAFGNEAGESTAGEAGILTGVTANLLSAEAATTGTEDAAENRATTHLANLVASISLETATTSSLHSRHAVVACLPIDTGGSVPACSRLGGTTFNKVPKYFGVTVLGIEVG
jgi:hypothetical protein